MVMRQGAKDSVKVMPSRGGIVFEVGLTNDTTIELVLRNAGCVTAIGTAGYEERQLTVLDLITPLGSATRGVYACTLTSCKRVVLPVAEGAIGFTKTTPPYLIGTAIDATGIVLATWGLITDPTDPTTDRLVERGPRVASGNLPGHVAIGTFDEDDGPDMIWDLPRGRGGFALELAYSSSLGVRLQALSNPIPLLLLDVLATDVTHDDHDDIILVARKLLFPGQAGVVVVPTHTVAPAKSIPVVTSCGS